MMAGDYINNDVSQEIDQLTSGKYNLKSVIENGHDINNEIIKFTNWLSETDVPRLSSCSTSVPLKSSSPMDTKSSIPLFFINETEVIPQNICIICKLNVYKDETHASCKSCEALQHTSCFDISKTLLHSKDYVTDITWACGKCYHLNLISDLEGRSETGCNVVKANEKTSNESLNKELTKVKNDFAILIDSDIWSKDLGNSDIADVIMNNTTPSKIRNDPVDPDLFSLDDLEQNCAINEEIHLQPNTIPITVKANDQLSDNKYFRNFDNKYIPSNLDSEPRTGGQKKAVFCESNARCLFVENKLTKVKYVSLYEGIYLQTPKVFDSLGFEYCFWSKTIQNNFSWMCVNFKDNCHSILEQADGNFEQFGIHNHKENFELYINALRSKAIENSPILPPNLDLHIKLLEKPHIDTIKRKRDEIEKNSTSRNLSIKSGNEAYTVKVHFSNSCASSFEEQEYTDAACQSEKGLYVENSDTKIRYVSLSKGSLLNTPKVYDSLGFGYTLRSVCGKIIWRCCKSGGLSHCRATLRQSNDKFFQLGVHNHTESFDRFANALKRKTMEKSTVLLSVSDLKNGLEKRKIKLHNLHVHKEDIKTVKLKVNNTLEVGFPVKMQSKKSADSTVSMGHSNFNEYKCEEILYISLRKGSRFIYDSLGFVYRLSKKTSLSLKIELDIGWECGKVITKKCPATLIQSGGDFLRKGQHSHAANIDCYNNALRCSHDIISNKKVDRNFFPKNSQTCIIDKPNHSKTLLIKDLENNDSFDHFNNTPLNSFNDMEPINGSQPCLNEEKELSVKNNFTKIRYISLKCGSALGNPKVCDSLGYSYTIRIMKIHVIKWQCTLCNGKQGNLYCKVTLSQTDGNFEQNGKHEHPANLCDYVKALQFKIAEKTPVILTVSDLKKSHPPCKKKNSSPNNIGLLPTDENFGMEVDVTIGNIDPKIKYLSLRNGTCLGNPKVCSSLGFEYSLKSATEDIIRWQCLHENGFGRCSAMLHQINGNFEQQGKHKHGENFDGYLKALSCKTSENSPNILSYSILNNGLQLRKLNLGCNPEAQNPRRKCVNFQQSKLENTSKTYFKKTTDKLRNHHSHYSDILDPVPAQGENRYNDERNSDVSFENEITKIKYVSLKNEGHPKIFDSLGFEYILGKAKKLTSSISITWRCIHGNIRHGCISTLVQINGNLDQYGEHNHSNTKGNFKKALKLKAVENSPAILPHALLCTILEKKYRSVDNLHTSKNLNSNPKDTPQKQNVNRSNNDFDKTSKKKNYILDILHEKGGVYKQTTKIDNVLEQERLLHKDHTLKLSTNNLVNLEEAVVEMELNKAVVSYKISQKSDANRQKSAISEERKNKNYGKILKNYNSTVKRTKKLSTLSCKSESYEANEYKRDTFSSFEEEGISGTEKSFGSSFNRNSNSRPTNNLSNSSIRLLDQKNNMGRTDSHVNTSSTDVLTCHLSGEQESAITKVFLSIMNIGYPIKPLSFESFFIENENKPFMEGAKFYFEKINLNIFSFSTIRPVTLWLKKFLLESTLLSERLKDLLNISSNNLSSAVLDWFFSNFEKLLKKNYWEDPYQYLSVNNSHLIFFCDTLELATTPILNSFSHEKSLQKIVVICCVSGMGQSIQPLFITKSSGTENCTNNVKKLDKFLISSSCDGKLNNIIFHLWLLQFDEELVQNDLPRPVIVFLNGDNACISFESIQFAKNRNIVLFFIPPNCSDELNPLTMSVFPPLKENFRKMIIEDVHVDGIPYIFVKAFEELKLGDLAQAGFKKAGLCPFGRLTKSIYIN